MKPDILTWDRTRPDLSAMRADLGRRLRPILEAAATEPALMLPLWRLFTQGDPVPTASLATLPLDELVTTGFLLRVHNDYLRSAICLSRQDLPTGSAWIASDFNWQSEESDYVGGPGNAAFTLAYARPTLSGAGCAIDLGTGSGALALGLSSAADEVIVTDLNSRALAFAELTSALAAQSWMPYCGDGIGALGGKQAAFIGWNPPFVIGNPGDPQTFRDSALGEGQSAQLIPSIGAALQPRGVGQFLANWVYRQSEPKDALLEVARAADLDCLIIERAVVPPDRYVQLWAGDGADRRAWSTGLASAGATAIGLGVITITPARQPVRRLKVISDYQIALHSLGKIVDDWLEC